MSAFGGKADMTLRGRIPANQTGQIHCEISAFGYKMGHAMRGRKLWMNGKGDEVVAG